jgi:hypothetical protein
MVPRSGLLRLGLPPRLRLCLSVVFKFPFFLSLTPPSSFDASWKSDFVELGSALDDVGVDGSLA